MEVIFGILIVMGGAILALLKQIGKLQSDKKLNDIAVEDAKQEQKQEQVQEEKANLKEELAKVEDIKAEDLSDKEIEAFWNGGKK